MTSGPLRGLFDGKPFRAKRTRIYLEPSRKTLQIGIDGEELGSLWFSRADPRFAKRDQALAQIVSGAAFSTQLEDGGVGGGHGSIDRIGDASYSLGTGFYVTFTSVSLKPYDTKLGGSQELGTASGRLFVTFDLRERSSAPNQPTGCSGDFKDAVVMLKEN